LALVDASHNKGWTWINSDFNYIECDNQVIPHLKFIKKISSLFNIDSFIHETLKFKDEKNNELFQRNLFEKEKPNLKLLNKDSYKYEQTNDELFYEIYKQDELYVLFAWTTLGYFKYEKFNNKQELLDLFIKDHSVMIDIDNI